MNSKPLYVLVASALQAYENCQNMENLTPWESIWLDRLEKELPAFLPSGSGFDAGSTLDIDVSSPEKLVFLTSFHHMNEHGSYDVWTDHKITVKPSLVHGFILSVSGSNRNDIKSYIHETFNYLLHNSFAWKPV